MKVGRIWGPEFVGIAGTVGQSFAWRLSITMMTLRLLAAPFVTGALLSSCLGCWSTVLQLRVCAYAVFGSVHATSQRLRLSHRGRLKREELEELSVLTMLAPTFCLGVSGGAYTLRWKPQMLLLQALVLAFAPLAQKWV